MLVPTVSKPAQSDVPMMARKPKKHVMTITPKISKFLKNFSGKNLIRYYLRKKDDLIGLLVAFKEENQVKIGWAQCNINLDVFNKQFALYVATTRAIKDYVDLEKYKNSEEYKNEYLNSLPTATKKAMPKFIERARIYYKL